MIRYLMLVVIIQGVHGRPGFPEFNFDTAGAIRQDKVNVGEVLAPQGTSTYLSCDPIFNRESAKQTATWYKDGVPVATVTGEQNAIYLNRNFTMKNKETIPEVGFLILTKIEPEDEGDYWCIRKDTGQLGEISRIKVAYLTPVSEGTELQYKPKNPKFGEPVEIECASTQAFPVPAINWIFNDSSILPPNMVVLPTGSLKIYRFTPAEANIKFECVLINFGGRTQASVILPDPLPAEADLVQEEGSTSNADMISNSTMMFLIGCLSTACLVLIYLFSGMIWYRITNRRPGNGRLPLWQSLLRADPALAPGFRKDIYPAPASSQPRLLQTDDV